MSGTTIDAIAEFLLGCANLGQETDRIERAILITQQLIYIASTTSEPSRGPAGIRISNSLSFSVTFSFSMDS